MPSQPSRQAPGDPGRQKMKVAPATPAVARLWIVEVPILAWLSMWKAIEKPSIRFSNSGSIASGVTSRPVKPVPPVVMIDVDAGIGDPALSPLRGSPRHRR